MKKQIMEQLNQIEKNYDVKILYAVESGSRGWGFESKDSDYDVRFIYIHKSERYLSIEEIRDVIELPIDNLLDINGWDIRKALKLYKKSNPSLLEWMNSPIVYKRETNFIDELRNLINIYFSSKSCIYHYLHMAEGNYREYLKKDMVRIKKYFYVLRPIMACMWVEKYKTQPPMEFEKLMESLKLEEELVKEIKELLRRKRQAEEMQEEKAIAIINEFIEEKLSYFNEYAKNLEVEKAEDIEKLNDLFRRTLKEAWD